MSTDPYRLGGAQQSSISTGATTRAELIAVEKARRQAVRQRREGRGDQAAVAAMSRAERAQRATLMRHLAELVGRRISHVEHSERLSALGRAIDLALSAIPAATEIRARWHQLRWDDLLDLARDSGSAAGPILLAFTDHGLAQLPHTHLDQLHAAAAGHLGGPNDNRPDSWKIARGLAALLEGASPTRDDIAAMARSEDLAIVDAALDCDPAVPTARSPRLTSAHQDYLTARTHPRLLDADALNRLGWEDEIRRRAFVAGRIPEGEPDNPWVLRHRLFQGDATALAEARKALPELRGVLGQLSVQEDVERHASDPSLWRLLDAVIAPGVQRVGHPPYDLWRNLSRARSALFAEDLRTAAWHLRVADPSGMTAPVSAEVHNMALYCAVRIGNVGSAQRHLKVLRTFATTMPRVARNVELARSTLRRIEEGDRRSALERFESPWVVLGMDEPVEPPGNRPWDAQWIRLQRTTKSDADRRIRVNQARQRLVAGEEPGAHFVTPLVVAHFEPSMRGVLFPGPKPLQRRTAPPGREDVRRLMDLAWHEAVVSALDEARPTDLWQELHNARRSPQL